MSKHLRPGVAKGGRLVKPKRIEHEADRLAKHEADKASRPAPSIPTAWFMEALGQNDWNERGWHGGGQIPIRKTQKTRPSKARHSVTRRAHPSLLRVTK